MTKFLDINTFIKKIKTICKVLLQVGFSQVCELAINSLL